MHPLESERREVLSMLSEGKVTVEEAERLLAALDAHASSTAKSSGSAGPRSTSSSTGSSSSSSSSSSKGYSSRKRRERNRSAGGFFHRAAQFGFGIDGDDLRKLADVLRREVSFAAGESPPPWDVCEPVGVGSSFTSGPELTVWSSGERLELAMADDDDSSIEYGDGRVRDVDPSVGVEIVLRGRCRVRVGRAVERLRVISAGGPVEAHGLVVQCEVRSLGGDIRLLSQTAPFQASSAGGNIDVELTEAARGRGAADSLGGDIELTLPPDLGGTLTALTLGGALRGDEIDHDASPLGVGRVEHDLAGERGPVDLSARTLGGDVRLRRARIMSGQAA